MSFYLQEDLVKLQVLNLAVKLYLTNPEQTEMLCQYVFSLARYDQNYDIRDRSRFLKQFIFPANGQPTVLSKNARKIFLAAKPAPLLESKYHGREQFQLGSLSHYLNIRATGYHDLPMFPEVAPDSTVRIVEVPVTNDSAAEPTAYKAATSTGRSSEKKKSSSKAEKKSKSFYSESEKSSEYSEEDGDNDDDEDNDDDGEEEESDESGSGSEESGEGESGSGKESSSGEESSDSEDDSSSDDGSESESEENETPKASTSKAQPPPPKSSGKKSASANNGRSNLDLLLDLDDISPSGPVMTPSLGGFLSPLVPGNMPISRATAGTGGKYDLVGPSFTPSTQELLNKITGHGLQINYRFTRGPHLFSAKMVSIELTLRNESHHDLENIRITNKSLPAGMELNEFAPIAKLSAGQSVSAIIGVDFNDSTQAANFHIESNAGTSKVVLKASLGELIRSVAIPEPTFRQEQAQLRGMNEHSATIETSLSKLAAIRTKIFEVANVAAVNRADAGDDKLLLLVGQTMTSKSLVLISVERCGDGNGSVLVTVNCEKMVVGSMLLNEIKTVLKN